jgi:hypothetical protein
MDTALWIVQSLLAGIFPASGLIKLTQPRLEMAAGPMGWAADLTDGQFCTIGLLEVVGPVGLILARWELRPVSCRSPRSGSCWRRSARSRRTCATGRLGAWPCRSPCSDWRCSSP